VLGARAIFSGAKLEGALLPGFQVKGSTIVVGLAIAVLLGLASGFVPAWQAARLPVTQTLRRVA
jgi:ABC-type lipoprotein release transport system permease subunit